MLKIRLLEPHGTRIVWVGRTKQGQQDQNITKVGWSAVEAIPPIGSGYRDPTALRRMPLRAEAMPDRRPN
jgi:hypothetical protein